MATTTTRHQDAVDPKAVKTAFILIAGALAVVFDTTIVSVALHQLAIDLHTSVTTIGWVMTGYLLALGVAVPLSTWALNRFGGKQVWMFALTVFLIGSIGASLAWSAAALIAWRVVQGVGGGLMLPVMATLVMQAAGGRALGRTTTLVALPALLGPILGPLVGGAIVTHLDWRYMFWVNVPFCLLGLFLAWRYLDAGGAAATRPRLDVVGLVLFTPGIAALILALSNAGADSGFVRTDVIVPLVASLVLLCAFVIHALRDRQPLIDVRLLTTRSVGSSTTVLFLSGFALYGAMLLLPLFYQQVRGVSALTAGLMLVPQGIGTMLCRPVAGSLTDRIGARSIAMVGFTLTAVSTIPFCFADAHTNTWVLAAWLVVRGVGLGAITMPVMTASYVGLAREQIPHSSVLSRTTQQVGGSFGTAVLAVILETSVRGASGTVGGFHVAFWWTAGFALIAMVLCIWLPGRAQVRRAVAPAGDPAPAADSAHSSTIRS